MKTFEDYYKKKLKKIAKCAKRDNVSIEEFLRINYKKTVLEYREWQMGFYNAKDCHSFWHRECTNKGIECHKCCHYYSIAEWDKMTNKERNNIKND
ncbi:MAG: hypothetical protein WC428_02150 [Candidatus Paceibacterota bacterium]